MINIDYIKKFPFAEKYLFNPNGLNLTSFSKCIQKKVLNGMTIGDVKFIDEIYKWKELVIQGNDIPCPVDHIEFTPKEIKHTKLTLIWKTVDYICTLAILPTLIIIGFFIWGDFLIIAIIVVLALLIRLTIHIKLIRNIKVLEQFFPFVTVHRKIDSKFTAKDLYSSLTDTSYDRYSEFFHLNISYYIRLNTYIAVYYSLVKNAISLYPDKILLYYKYGENRSAVYKYKVKEKVVFLKIHKEKTICGFKNIFDILKNIDKEENQKFLSSIISRSKVENISDLNISTELEEYYNLQKDYLLTEGEFILYTNKWCDKPIYKENETYKFSKDKYFRRYVTTLSILGTLLLGFYPSYFRYHYVQNRLAENEYKMLLEDYNANYKLLYDLESVNLVISVRNRMVYNNHVGNSWGYRNSINEVDINSNKAILPYHYGDSIYLHTVIIEYDNWNDVSSRVDNIDCTKEELIEGVDISIDSYVYENRGRYSGCHAKWTSRYFIEVEKPYKPIYENIKIPSSEVILNFFKSF